MKKNCLGNCCCIQYQIDRVLQIHNQLEKVQFFLKKTPMGSLGDLHLLLIYRITFSSHTHSLIHECFSLVSPREMEFSVQKMKGSLSPSQTLKMN